MNEFSFERYRRLILLAVLAAFISAPLAAQDTTADGRKIVPRDTADPARHRTLFTYRDAALAAGFTGLTFAMFPLDRNFAVHLQDPDLRENKFLAKSATGVEVITTPGAFIIGGGLYVAGKVGHHDNLADVGWHGTEAVIVASGTVSLLKGILGRARPYVVDDTIPHDFGFLRGFGHGALGKDSTGKPFTSGDYVSFPSGHSATAFAAAASVTSEVRRLYPDKLWIVAPVLYGGATLVGLSRMYHNQHWASDVVVGAGIGTFSGLKVVRYSHAHPDNFVDRLILSARIVPDGQGGGLVGFELPAP